MTTHYEILGVDRKSTAKAVQKAYERKLKALGKDPDPLQERIVKEAFATLSNPVKRADYDSRLGEDQALPLGAGSAAPLIIAVVGVAVTAAGIGFFVMERGKDQEWMKREEQRAAEREKAKRPPSQQATKRQEK